MCIEINDQSSPSAGMMLRIIADPASVKKTAIMQRLPEDVKRIRGFLPL
jgi:hypothetical protein